MLCLGLVVGVKHTPHMSFAPTLRPLYLLRPICVSCLLCARCVLAVVSVVCAGVCVCVLCPSRFVRCVRCVHDVSVMSGASVESRLCLGRGEPKEDATKLKTVLFTVGETSAINTPETLTQ